MATASDTDAVGPADYECSSDSDSSESFREMQTSPLMCQLLGPNRSRDKALPIFDLRHQLFARPCFKKLTLKSISKEAVQQKVAEEFKANQDRVLVLESKGRVEETLVQTWVILLPEYDTPPYQTVLIEAFESLDQTHGSLLCTRFQRNVTIKAVYELILNELEWKSAALCLKSRVLSLDMTTASLDGGDFFKLQVIKSQTRNICMVFQPKPNVSYSYGLEADITMTVKNLKCQFLKEFKDDMLTREIEGDQVIHLFFHDMFLEDSTCIGMVLRGSKDETFQIHVAVPDAICVTLKYKIQRGKTRVPYFQQTSIRANCSTGDLRSEAAKYLNVDPKAIKLAIADKRIEEHTSLEGILGKGTQISVGVKKKKTVLISHPETHQQCAVDMFMLETVHVLKTDIANTFDVDPLQISLQCRGADMHDKELLLNYPIKNKMELTMELYHNRIVAMVVIIFKKKRLRIVIDDIDKSTVDDVLMYCACKFRYSRSHSRAIFEQQCLYKFDTLREAGVHSGSTLYIVYFENAEKQQGNLIRIYTVRPDGHINPRLGSVCEGVLLHASKKLSLQRDEDESRLNNGWHLPPGIHMDMAFTQPHDQLGSQQIKHSQSDLGKASAGDKTKLRKINKEKFLRKAAAVCQRRFDMEQTYRKQMDFFSGPASQAEVAASDDGKFEASGEGKMIRRQSAVKFFLSESSTENLTDSSLFDTSTPQTIHSRQEPPGPSYRQPNTLMDVSVAVDERKDLSQANLDKDQPLSQANFEKQTVQAEAQRFLEKSVDTCSEFQQSIDEIQDLQVYQGAATSSADDSTSEYSSSQDKTTDTTFDQNLQRFNEMVPYETKCPYLKHHPYNWPIAGLHIRHPSRQRRQRCVTLGEAELSDTLALMVPNMTCPVLPQHPSNADLNTSGITVPLLSLVSHHVGKKWKQLARQLHVDETTLENVEYEQRGLYETAFQTLLSWKRARGTAGTRVELLGALRSVDLQSVVEKCEEKLSYQTA